MSNNVDGPDPSRGVGELFADATRDAPPPSFDLNDITATSARITARRRRATIGVSTLGVVVLAAGLVTTVSVVGHTGGDQTAIAGGDAPSSSATTQAKPFSVQEEHLPSGAPQGSPSDPVVLPKQGGASTGHTGPRAGAPRPGCAKADRELATALAGELPAAPVNRPVPVIGQCPAGTRAAAYRFESDGHRGTVAVLLVPAGVPDLPAPPGAETATARTGDGAELVVRSQPDSPLDDPPITSAATVRRIAERVAARF